MKRIFFIIAALGFLLVYCQNRKNTNVRHTAYALTSLERLEVKEPPQHLDLDPFYKKYVDANGIPIVGSEKVPDSAFLAARKTIKGITQALSMRIHQELLNNGARIGIMARYEGTTDIPEHAHLENDTSMNWDVRARGLGGSLRHPLNTCAEENLLCYQIDKYHAEDILIHEFAHTIHSVGILPVDTSFNKCLKQTFEEAKSKGKWENTYAATNIYEYWAEGVQTWFNVNAEVRKPDRKHNSVNVRSELKAYDPGLYAILNDYFAETDSCFSCHCKIIVNQY